MSNPELVSQLRQSNNPFLQKLASRIEAASVRLRYYSLEADIVIVGSGPIGATYARVIHEQEPNASIIMIEAGSQEDPVIGAHHKNAVRYQRNSDAFVPYINACLEPVSVPPVDPYLSTLPSISWTPPNDQVFPHQCQNPAQARDKNLPAAAVSKTVGGMGAHWTCACPDPAEDEHENNPIDNDTFIRLLSRARQLLKVRTDQYDDSIRHQTVKNVLAKGLGADKITNTPLAVKRSEKSDADIWTWSGADTILGPKLKFVASKDLSQKVKYRLFTETLAMGVSNVGDTSQNVWAYDVGSARDISDPEGYRYYNITAKKAVVLACGAIGTPQLLFHSLRYPPKSLGRYLSEQTMAFCQVVLKRSIIDEIEKDPRFQDAVAMHHSLHATDPLPIPSNDPEPQIYLKYQTKNGYIALIDRNAFFTGVRPEIDPRVVVDLRFYGRNDIQQENCVMFDQYAEDRFGMPRATFNFDKSNADRERENKMVKDMADVASLLGGFIPGSEPQIMPMGLALHITGTTRIGNDPNTSVADSRSRVHGFKNLWVGGNGCIPDSTACNPTLTSVALAIHGAEALVEHLQNKS
ncbi:GMC oxidoreductase [Peniophora sp. CONT]|nr:GMC oxidoreductase [Peniophora sp. CONT]